MVGTLFRNYCATAEQRVLLVVEASGRYAVRCNLQLHFEFLFFHCCPMNVFNLPARVSCGPSCIQVAKFTVSDLENAGIFFSYAIIECTAALTVSIGSRRLLVVRRNVPDQRDWWDRVLSCPILISAMYVTPNLFILYAADKWASLDEYVKHRTVIQRDTSPFMIIIKKRKTSVPPQTPLGMKWSTYHVCPSLWLFGITYLND